MQVNGRQITRHSQHSYFVLSPRLNFYLAQENRVKCSTFVNQSINKQRLSRAGLDTVRSSTSLTISWLIWPVPDLVTPLLRHCGTLQPSVTALQQPAAPCYHICRTLRNPVTTPALPCIALVAVSQKYEIVLMFSDEALSYAAPEGSREVRSVAWSVWGRMSSSTSYPRPSLQAAAQWAVLWRFLYWHENRNVTQYIQQSRGSC